MQTERAIDFNDLTYSSDTLLSSNFVMPSKCCIFKIPNILSRHNEKAYAPNAFSIGPWHLGKPHLESTQKIKLKYLQGLIRRSPNPDDKLRQLEDAIREVANDARECYAGPVGPSISDLVKILVLDGCFIVELFRKTAEQEAKDKGDGENAEEPKDEDDPIFSKSCMLKFLYHDLILLENQIPWFVLECLFDMTKTPAESKPLDQLAIKFFENMFSTEELSNELFEMEKFCGRKSKHILDLLRNWLILSRTEEKVIQPNSGNKREMEAGKGWFGKMKGMVLTRISRKKTRYSGLAGFQSLPSATYLREAGIKFRRVESNSILDVKFIDGVCEGVLEMPPLLVQETTETIFRNLISLEQCTPNYSPKITSYAIFIDNLIDTTKDMEILCKKKIIDNWLNKEDSTQFFNKLYNDTHVKKFYYYDLCNRVNDYCHHSLPRYRAILNHNYFDTVWHGAATIAAILILLLTFVGTGCSIYQAKYTKK